MGLLKNFSIKNIILSLLAFVTVGSSVCTFGLGFIVQPADLYPTTALDWIFKSGGIDSWQISTLGTVIAIIALIVAAVALITLLSTVVLPKDSRSFTALLGYSSLIALAASFLLTIASVIVATDAHAYAQTQSILQIPVIACALFFLIKLLTEHSGALTGKLSSPKSAILTVVAVATVVISIMSFFVEYSSIRFGRPLTLNEFFYRDTFAFMELSTTTGILLKLGFVALVGVLIFAVRAIFFTSGKRYYNAMLVVCLIAFAITFINASALYLIIGEETLLIGNQITNGLISIIERYDANEMFYATGIHTYVIINLILLPIFLGARVVLKD